MAIDYVHETLGRLRIRCRALRKQSERIALVKGQLESAAGVASVTVNPVTGSFTILYDPAQTTSAGLLDIWKANDGELESPIHGFDGADRTQLLVPVAFMRGRTVSPVTARIAKVMTAVVVEKAIEWSLLTIVAAVL
jgi:copper chaperone CopZ